MIREGTTSAPHSRGEQDSSPAKRSTEIEVMVERCRCGSRDKVKMRRFHESDLPWRRKSFGDHCRVAHLRFPTLRAPSAAGHLACSERNQLRSSGAQSRARRKRQASTTFGEMTSALRKRPLWRAAVLPSALFAQPRSSFWSPRSFSNPFWKRARF